MPLSDDIRWLKDQFGAQMQSAVAGTPISVDLLCAIAVQETGYIWRKLRARNDDVPTILRLCVGDTIDYPKRKNAFPKDKAALIAWQQGQEMFDLAHQLLIEMAQATGIPEYGTAAKNPNKFVHGFGIFQRDLQFFKNDPAWFLNQKWADIDVCAAFAVKELTEAVQQLGYAGKSSLTDREATFVAIVYNMGFKNFDASKGAKQGFLDDAGIYYGEYIERFLITAHEVAPTTATSAAGVTGSLPQVAQAAKAELSSYGGIDEGKEPLFTRIKQYVAAADGDPASFSPTKDAWSAAFISFCVRSAGATPQQFKFSLAHSQFVYAAIANASAGQGVFRGHPIEQYRPKPGDIIQNNRDNQTFNFAFASTNQQYTSHSAIVVAIETRYGVRGAVTIGGNEGNTVAEGFVPLTADGFVEQRVRNPYICVIENRLASVAGAAEQPGRYRVAARPVLNLRGGPATSFDVKQELATGTLLQVLEFVDGEQGSWALVDLENDGIRDGFVFSRFLVPA